MEPYDVVIALTSFAGFALVSLGLAHIFVVMAILAVCVARMAILFVTEENDKRERELMVG